MLEMRETAPGRVEVWNGGVPAGGAEWGMGELSWGREQVKTARLVRFEARPEDAQALRAYLDYLWQTAGVAAVYEPDGRLTWFSKALERSYSARRPL